MIGSSAEGKESLKGAMRWLRVGDGLRRCERGVAALEFGLLLPLLCLILLGAIDLGRFAYSAITVANAARTGAAVCVHSSTCNLTDAQIKEYVRNEASPYVNLDDALPTVDIGVDRSDSQSLKVTVRYQFQTLIPWPGIPPSLWVGSSARMPRGIV